MYLKEKPISTICVIEFSKREKLTRRKGGFFFLFVYFFNEKPGNKFTATSDVKLLFWVTGTEGHGFC